MADSRQKYAYETQPVYHNTSGMIRGPQLRPPIKFAPPHPTAHRSDVSPRRPGAPAVVMETQFNDQANMDGKLG